MYKKNYGNIPNKDKIHYYLIESNENLGEWVSHSKLIGKSARDIADKIGLDKDIAYAIGSLHDIGKSKRKTGLSQIMESFYMLRNEAYFFPAKISISHSFIIKDIKAYVGDDNIGKRDRKILENFLISHDYNDYDKLIQLLDNSITDTFVGIEKKQEILKEKYGKIPFEKEKYKILKEYEMYFEEKLGEKIEYFLRKNDPLSNSLGRQK